uniref:WXG100 family type VII secretion target n=1 Tax=Panagrolaimus sp. PS1159 TaxID=55785 RepID=A0AC35G035_9BILA
MSKSNMDALEADVQDLAKGAEELHSNILSIQAI